MVARVRHGAIDHVAERNDPDNGMCAVEGCGRRIEAPKAYWAAQKQGDINTVRHMRGRRGLESVSNARRHPPPTPRKPKEVATTQTAQASPILEGTPAPLPPDTYYHNHPLSPERLERLYERMTYLESRVFEGKKSIGVLKNQVKELQNRVKTLENTPNKPKTDHRRLVDGGIHAKEQRKQHQNDENSPKLLKAG